MTIKNKSKTLPKYTSLPVFDIETGLRMIGDEDFEDCTWNSDRSFSCCGVLELEGMISDFFKKGSPCVCKDNKIQKWIPSPNTYGGGYTETMKCSHPKKVYSEKEYIKAFKEFEVKASKLFGMITVYLLPDQEKGDFGELVRKAGWEFLGKFWNPKTRNTLYHYRKTLHKVAPRRKKKGLFKT